jgi:hypothetical protein
MKFSYLKSLFYTFLLLVLQSCIEYEEKLSINNDDSGKLSYKILMSSEGLNFGKSEKAELPEFLDPEKLKDSFKQRKGIKLISVNTLKEEQKVGVEVSLEFNHIENLNQAFGKELENIVGVFKVEDINNSQKKLTRTVGNYKNKESDLDKLDTTQNQKQIAEQLLKGYEVVYTLNLPGAIVTHNAADSMVNNQNNSITWNTNMLKLTQNSFQMEVVYNVPRSFKTLQLIVGIGSVVVFIAGIIYMIRRK